MLRQIAFSVIIISIVGCFQFPVQPAQDVQTCTVAVQALTDSLFELASAIENNYFDPGADKLVKILYSVQGIITICANSPVSIKKYDQCIKGLYTVLPIVGNLVDAIQHGYKQNIIEDSVKIGLVLTDGIALCIDISA